MYQQNKAKQIHRAQAAQAGELPKRNEQKVFRVGRKDAVIKEDRISIELPQRVLNAALEAAKKSAAHYSALVDLGKAPYGDNSVERHYNGKIGELGAHYLFTRLCVSIGKEIAIDPVFMDDARDAECDLIVEGLRIEIKSWRPADYEHYGPCIAERQAKKLAKKCSVILYATYNHATNEFCLRGFNFTEDVEGVVPVLTGRIGKQVLNRMMTPRTITELPFLAANHKDQQAHE